MEKQIYRMEKKVFLETYEMVSSDVIEKQFIIQMLSSIPLEYLKKLVNFREFDFRKNTNKMHELSNEEIDFYYRLESQNVVLLEAKIEI